MTTDATDPPAGDEHEAAAAELGHPIADLPAAIVEDLVKKRSDAIQAARVYDDAKANAASCKKAWDQKREIFEATFDRAVAGVAEPALPFDGVHQSDVEQPAQPADDVGGEHPDD